MRRFLACVSLGALLVAGCGIVQEGEGSAVAAAEIDREKVTPQDLQAAVKDERVKAFYAARGWQPIWTGELAGKLEAAFADAGRHAINAQSFLKNAREGASAAEREAGLTLATLGYAQALAGGMVDPAKIYEVYEVTRPKVDVRAGFASAVQSGEIGPWLTSLAPADPEYRALSEAYLAFKNKAGAQPRSEQIPFGGKIERGGKDPRVPAIAASLRTNGYLAAPAPAPQPKDKGKEAPKQAAPQAASTTYSAEMAAAVSKLQEDYGINPDGVIGDDTLEALNIGPVERARILAVNLERRRWLVRQAPATRIDVNTAGAFLDYWRDGAKVDSRRVVVGQPDWETPELTSPMTRLVANPPWTVPESIAKEEILPKGAAYMARENIVSKNGRLVQQPGPKSALGLVKFDMANTHQIYLHDTPAKALFAGSERHSSHGCARVQDALGFARLIAGDQGLSERFEKALATGEETPVNLKEQIPVRLLYHTAYWDGTRVLFRTDPYGWDDKLASALGLGGEIRRRVRQKVDDVGP